MRTRIILDEKDIPTRWYNILADMPHPPAPPLHPATGKPVTPDDLSPLFPMGLILQEVCGERWVDIPEQVLEVYGRWRPTPLCRAPRFEKALQTPARIYYKYEGVSPPGSHKPNTAVAQAYYNKKEGVRRLCTETGAGQWGSALSFACHLFGLDCTVYMVRVSYQQKPYRRTMMRTWGAEVVPSPSDRTAYGRRALAAKPDSLGSLGMAISEAVEDAASRDDTKYSLGSVLNHVLLHQTIIGLEAQKQMALAQEYPDIVIGCHGGGSNFAGLVLPFVRDKLQGREIRIVAAEPSACPSLTRGTLAYDFGDTAGLAPLVKMYTLGHGFVPAGIHAGGLRYHGAAPIVSQLLADGLIEARAYAQLGVFESAVAFARAEGIIPAPEAAHAIKAVADEAILAREEGKEKTILFNLSGHGHFDMAAYDAYFDGTLVDFHYPERELAEAIAKLPAVGS